jgi:hypothetical protein
MSVPTLSPFSAIPVPAFDAVTNHRKHSDDLYGRCVIAENDSVGKCTLAGFFPSSILLHMYAGVFALEPALAERDVY